MRVELRLTRLCARHLPLWGFRGAVRPAIRRLPHLREPLRGAPGALYSDGGLVSGGVGVVGRHQDLPVTGARDRLREALDHLLLPVRLRVEDPPGDVQQHQPHAADVHDVRHARPRLRNEIHPETFPFLLTI